MIRREAGLAWATGLLIVLASATGLFLLLRDDGQALMSLLATLEAQIRDAPLATMLAFTVLMAITTCLTLPTATVLCLSAGYLFGAFNGALLSWIGATTGAALTFLLVRFIAGERVREFFLRGRAAGLVEMIERDAFFYLMALRIVPVAPFFAVNAAGAMIRISLGRFVLATGLGLLPILAIYASVGAGVDTLVEANELDGWSLLARPQVFGPLLALAALVLTGGFTRRWLKRRAAIAEAGETG